MGSHSIQTRWRRWIVAGPISLVLLAACTDLQAQSGRAEAPIRAVRISDGTVRFAVPITVGGVPVLAGLDTGSAGLQLLPAAQHRLQPAQGQFRASYGSGVLLTGQAAHAQVQIGSLRGDVVANQVSEVGCVPAKPECGASRVPMEQFGILGDGRPGEGFPALLGLRTQRESTAGHPGNPLKELGVRRWIVEMPQPETGQEGRLILNPTEEEVSGFTEIASGAATGEVQACLDRPEPARTHVCGSALLDTGAPGITVLGADAPEQVRAGAPARITFGTEAAPRFAIGVQLNERAQMSRYVVNRNTPASAPTLHLGVLPYLAFSVLYDAQGNGIALRPRRGYPDGPVLLSPMKP